MTMRQETGRPSRRAGGARVAEQMRLDTAPAEAIVAEVQYVFRSAGPADLDSLEPQYLRPIDAKLPGGRSVAEQQS